MPRPFLLLAAALVALPAFAAPADDDDTIIVTGERLTRPQVRQRSYDYIRKALADTAHGQHGRWFGAICPKVIGARPATEAMFIDRFATAAKVLDVRVEAPGCRPNIVVWFTADAPALMRTIAAKSPTALEEASSSERRRLLTGDDPVRWFYETRSVGNNGQVVAEGSAATGGQLAGVNAPPVLNRFSGSRLTTESRLAMTGATIIIDVSRAEGHSLEALAAHSVMLGFSRTRLVADRPPTSSILTLFSPRPPETRPADLSPVDEAFLVALYKTAPDQWANKQSALIVSAMVDDLFAQPRAAQP